MVDVSGVMQDEEFVFEDIKGFSNMNAPLALTGRPQHIAAQQLARLFHCSPAHDVSQREISVRAAGRRFRRRELRDRCYARKAHHCQAWKRMTGSPVLLHDLLAGKEHDDARTALTRGDQSYTYSAFKEQVERLARRLIATGATRGDRVAIFLPKSFEECAAIFAASRADLVFVPVNPSLRPAQVRHIIEDCGAGILVTSAEMRPSPAKRSTGCRLSRASRISTKLRICPWHPRLAPSGKT